MDNYESFIRLNNQRTKTTTKNKKTVQSKDKLSKALQRNLIRRKNARQKTITQPDSANKNPDSV